MDLIVYSTAKGPSGRERRRIAPGIPPGLEIRKR